MVKICYLKYIVWLLLCTLQGFQVSPSREGDAYFRVDCASLSSKVYLVLEAGNTYTERDMTPKLDSVLSF